MLELYEPDGAFEWIETWLRERGFFAPGGEGLVADLYLAYGLSSTIRRTSSPAPPEPCPLPLAACAVRSDRHDVSPDNVDARAEVVGAEIGEWRRTWDPGDYGDAVARVRDAIGRGDVYQVNLVQHLSAAFAGSSGTLATRLSPLTRSNGLPFADAAWRVLEGTGWAIVRATPELFSRGGVSASGRSRSRGRGPAAAAPSSSPRTRTPRST